MPGKAAKITITERQQEILQTFSRSVTAPSRLRQRAAIIILAVDGLLNDEIAERVGLTHRPVGRWRRRWANAWNPLLDRECCKSRAVLRRAIEAVLTDEPRPGAPAKFTPAQVTPILAVACEPPEKSGRPITHWTAQERTDEVVRRGMVASISPSQVSRSLREAGLQPHTSRSGLHTTETDPARFEAQVKTVCDTDLAAPERERTPGTHTVSVDEMTGVQALERIAPSTSMIAGTCRLIEFESTRHGTLCLIANLVVTTGELLRPTIGPTRTETDFASPIEQTVATDAEGSWVFVVDNLNIPCTESLVKLVAAACEVQTDLGQKGVRGVLKSVASRHAFVSESSPRIRFVYLPKHSSWRNQIEVVFGVIMRKVIRRGVTTAFYPLTDSAGSYLSML
jgi:transposase